MRNDLTGGPSWIDGEIDAPPMQSLAGRGHVRHQLGRCLQKPIRIGYMGMAQIGAQGGDVTGNCLGIVRTAIEGADSECVTQIVDTGSW